jgi:hypothetical protein
VDGAAWHDGIVSKLLWGEKADTNTKAGKSPPCQ